MNNQRNVRLSIEYDGTNYHGWQSQKNAVTIQDTVESALKDLTGHDIRITASGRTDTGVHARGQVANFLLESRLTLNEIEDGLNAYLPNDIVIKEVEIVPVEFHSRFDAKKRIYQYYIIPVKTAIFRNFCWQVFYRLDDEILDEIAPVIIGDHDFSSFCKNDESRNSNQCRVLTSSWSKKEDFLVYRIEADRFLHGMVRTIVGTMIDVARGRFTTNEFREIFYSKDRNQAGQTAPPQGLFLEAVYY